jgi:hypothetical protein
MLIEKQLFRFPATLTKRLFHRQLNFSYILILFGPPRYFPFLCKKLIIWFEIPKYKTR